MYFGYTLGAILAGGIIFWQLLKKFFPWLPEDLITLKLVSSTYYKLSKFKKNNMQLCDKVIENARKMPHHNFLKYEEEEWTYQDIDKWSNRCARALRKLGLSTGDKAGIMLMNEPAFIALWIGCNKAGLCASFLNYNLRQNSLLHCIDLSDVKILIIGKDDVLFQAAKQIDSELRKRNILVFVYGPATDGYESLESLVDDEPFEDCPGSWRKDVEFTDPICYIFTSGTTGLPKAVNVNNQKAWSGALILGFIHSKPQDVIYTAMPLYHSAASLIGVCGCILAGSTMVLRKKFSASHFLSDCRKYDVTIAQYVGETLRYVCNLPESPDDKNHRIRAVLGNGLRPDVWKVFLKRFGSNIHVLEFYAATEGNTGFFNFHNHYCCIGKYSPLLKALGAAAIVKYNYETEEMVRDSNGRGILANYDEPGLLIGKITPRYAISSYKGNKALTEKKILRDVFKTGDEYFNTGDLMKIDNEHKVFFCDRIGDTFRWKGENVSTNEVGDTIAQAPGIREANVYGVQIPGKDGRAGMAAIVLEDASVDFQALYSHICEALPSYARPLFLRIQKELEITGTNKQRKVNLKKEGYSLDNVGDDLIYFIDNSQKTYVQLTREMQNNIENGTIRI